MEIFVAGSGVGVPNITRRYPGLLVKSETETVLIDPGPGSLRQLLKFGFSYNDIDLVLLTHFHPDHCLDFISFLFACRNPIAPRKKNIFIVGPPGLKSFYDGLKTIFGNAVIPNSCSLSLNEIRDDILVRNKSELRIKPVAHTDNSIGIRYRSADNKILCYSGDTGYCKNIVELAEGSDLLILESSFPDIARVEGHLTPSLAGRIAREAKAKKLLLTHLYPVCEGFDIISECKKEFDGIVNIARDLMRIKI